VSHSLRLAILVPTYNESKNIDALLGALAQVGQLNPGIVIEVFVLDDSSPDGTGQVVHDAAQRLLSNSFRAELIERPKKEGLGKAYIDGLSRMLLLPMPPDYVLQMDADLSHNPKYISEFISLARSGCDFVLGSRYIPGGSSPNWQWHRKLLSRGGNMYARFVLGSHVSDYTGGFNMYSLVLLKKIDLTRLNHTGYGFLIDLKYKAAKACECLGQVPIEFTEREHGVSKMPASTIWRNFFMVLSIKINSLISR
jgi:dolichol-phosphate mannosyltransferase